MIVRPFSLLSLLAALLLSLSLQSAEAKQKQTDEAPLPSAINRGAFLTELS